MTCFDWFSIENRNVFNMVFKLVLLGICHMRLLRDYLRYMWLKYKRELILDVTFGGVKYIFLSNKKVYTVLDTLYQRQL